MDLKEAKSLIAEIVSSVDYDIWKDTYNPDTVEDEEDCEKKTDELLEILSRYVEIEGY